MSHVQLKASPITQTETDVPMNGADRLCDTLLGLGVDACFANPGTSEMHFVAALDRKPAMRCILGLAEGVVTGAADGYARMADKPAATLLHLGPGLANGLANLHNARRANTPVMNIVGEHATYHLPLDAPLTSDIKSLARPMSVWVGRASRPEDVERRTLDAYRSAMSSPGPATLILTADAAWGEVAPGEPLERLPVQMAFVEARALRSAADAIRGGKRVGILLGGKALRATAMEFAAGIEAAHGVKLFAQGMNSRTERGRGRHAITRVPYGIEQAVSVLKDLDVLILVGAPEPVAFFAYPGKPGHLVPGGCAIIPLAGPHVDLGGYSVASGRTWR